MAFLSGCIGEKQITPVTTPVSTPISTATVTTPTAAGTPVSEATPTGKVKLIKLDNRRGFNPGIQTIEPGDEIIWNNIEVDTIKLISDDGLFNDQTLAYDQQYRTIFRKAGTYKFHLEKNKDLNGTVLVKLPSEIVQTPAPTSTEPKELPLNSIFVSARMLRPAYWSSDKYELDSLKVKIINQREVKLTIKAQIVNNDTILEEKSFSLEKSGSSHEFTNEKNHFIKNQNVTLRLLINDYLPVEHELMVADSLT